MLIGAIPSIELEADARLIAINMPLRAKARRRWKGARASNTWKGKRTENVSALKRRVEIGLSGVSGATFQGRR
jgi:hypothetical protein